MVRIIAHRGKLNEHCVDNNIGNIDYILGIKKYFVEVDVRLNEFGKLCLGHDECGEEVPDRWCHIPSVIFHCKNVLTLAHVIDNNRRYYWKTDFFFHDRDDCTLTNRGHIWLHPDYSDRVPSNCYLMLTKRPKEYDCLLLKNAKGICTDWPEEMEDFVG